MKFCDLKSCVGRSAWATAAFALLLAGCNDAMPPMAATAMPVTVDGPGPMGTAVQGTFVRTRYAVTGTASLVVEGTLAQLDLSADFTIANTPGPVLYLNTTNDPNTGTPLRIGALQRRSGAQRYTFQIPPGAQYRWIIIWCDPFNVPMAEAAIPLTPAGG
jgi:hypothetical protein